MEEMESKCSGVCAQTTACSSSSFESTVWFSQRKRIARHAFRLWPAPTFAGTPLSRTCRLRTGTAEKISRKNPGRKMKTIWIFSAASIADTRNSWNIWNTWAGIDWMMGTCLSYKARQDQKRKVFLYHLISFYMFCQIQSNESHRISLLSFRSIA